MIICHEGLPRSGKSYEAMVRRIIPAVEAGRMVWTNIEGIDHAKVAELVNKPVEHVQDLLRTLTEDDLQKLPTLGLKNCLLVLDEVQNYWGNRVKLGQDLVKFVAEHGHHGIDIILMTQDVKDIHAIWRRRIEIRQVTLKLTGLGKSDSYSVVTYRGKGSELYEKVGTKIIKYDPKFFGTYKSYSDSDISTAVLKDDRASVWGNSLFTQVMPGALLAAAAAVWYLWGWFHPDVKEVKAPQAKQERQEPPPQPAPKVPSQVSRPKPATKSEVANRIMAERYPASDLFKELHQDYRIRLAGIARKDGRLAGVVEWRSDGGRVYHRMTFEALEELGAKVTAKENSAIIRYAGNIYVATSWPIEDPMERVSTQGLSHVQQASGITPAPPTPPTSGDSPFAPRPASSEATRDGELIAWMRAR